MLCDSLSKGGAFALTVGPLSASSPAGVSLPGSADRPSLLVLCSLRSREPAHNERWQVVAKLRGSCQVTQRALQGGEIPVRLRVSARSVLNDGVEAGTAQAHASWQGQKGTVFPCVRNNEGAKHMSENGERPRCGHSGKGGFPKPRGFVPLHNCKKRDRFFYNEDRNGGRCPHCGSVSVYW